MPSQSALRKILFLTANPKDTSRLRLDEEIRDIHEGLKLAAGRETFELISLWAVRTKDLRRALLEYEPQVIHFSGHGADEPGLILEDELGNAQSVASATLAQLFKLCPSVNCVFLNACYSHMQARAIAQYVPYVIGMTDAIADTTAIKFAVGFYDALGYGRTIPDAYEFGITAIDSTPIVVKRDIGHQPEDAGMAEPVTPILICSDVQRPLPPTSFIPPQAYRYRQILINKVRNFWIKGFWNLHCSIELG